MPTVNQTMTLPDTTKREGQWQASDLLCKMCGWRVTEIDRSGPTMRECWTFVPGEVKEVYQAYLLATSKLSGFPNLYDPANMALAWRVLNWAGETQFGGNITSRAWNNFWIDMRILPPADAQRAWLDKILKLAIEAGLVAAANESQ